METTDIATLILDRQLCIEGGTPRACAWFNIRTSDMGRPLSNVSPWFVYDQMIEDVQSVLDTAQPIGKELENEEGTWFFVRIGPYRTADDTIDGVVITFVDITALKTAQLETEHEREHAMDIVDTVWEPLLVLDEDLRVQSANDAFYTYFEVAPEATTGRLIYKLGNGQWDIPELRRLLEEILPEETTVTNYNVEHDFEYLGRRVMRLNARQIDQKQLILLAIEDITERRQAGEELRASEEHFRALVNASSYVVYRMNPDWSVMRELDGQGFIADTKRPTEAWMDAYIHPDDQPEIKEAIEEAIRMKSMFELEHRVRRPDGTLGWTHSRAVPLFNDEGEIVEWFGVASDITERKRAVQQLHAERNFIDNVLDTVGALIVVVDVDGRIVRFNKECEAVSGYTAAEAEGKNVVELLIPPEDEEGVRSVIEQHRAGMEQSTHENHWVTKEGKQRLIRWSSTALRDEAGQARNIIGTGIDITERREMEREMVTVSDEERRRIGQDLHDMLASQLAGVAMMARTLISKLDAGERVTADEFRKVADLIDTAGEQARTLSHSLMPLEVQDNELAGGLRKLVQRQEDITGVSCSFEADDAVPKLSGAIASHLYRIAAEAVNNAVKHARPDAIRIRLRVEGDRLVLSVQDDGVGIPEAPDPTNGIGLHMMQYRAELMDAQLEVSSSVENGTVVRCTLSLDAVQRETDSLAEPG